jgi:mannosidase alpha-like ER degradation enhancer 2
MAFVLGICLPACSPALRVNKAELAERVRREFHHAWNGYRQYAWGHDALLPLSNGYRDWHAKSLLMTPLDAFDTMLLMGLDEAAAEAKELILEQLTFDRDFSVQVFEIVIRSLGGMITAYQMDGDQRFLDLAVDLDDRLLPAYESATGMPYGRVHLQTGAKEWQVSNPAERRSAPWWRYSRVWSSTREPKAAMPRCQT